MVSISLCYFIFIGLGKRDLLIVTLCMYFASRNFMINLLCEFLHAVSILHDKEEEFTSELQKLAQNSSFSLMAFENVVDKIRSHVSEVCILKYKLDYTCISQTQILVLSVALKL